MEFGGGGDRGVRLNPGYARIDGLQEVGGRPRLRVCPLGSGDGTATIMVAATGVADDGLIGL